MDTSNLIVAGVLTVMFMPAFLYMTVKLFGHSHAWSIDGTSHISPSPHTDPDSGITFNTEIYTRVYFVCEECGKIRNEVVPGEYHPLLTVRTEDDE